MSGLPRFVRVRAGALALLWSAALAGAASAEAPADQTRAWVTAWATSIQDPLPAGFPTGSPPLDKVLPRDRAVDQSFRLIVRPLAGGDAIRVRFSNLTGTQPVTLAGIKVGLRQAGRAVAEQRPVRFGGADAVTIAPGRDALSDPLNFALAPERDVAVSFHLRGESGPIAWHAKAMTTSYATAPGAGDRTADAAGADFAHEIRSWPWLTEVQARDAGAPERTAIVALGDSITDGTGSTVDGHDRWTDVLARRLREAGSRKVVVNAGIGGNRVATLRWGAVLAPREGPKAPDERCVYCGDPAIVRLERDVFGRPNVSDVILYAGVNDINAGGTYGDIISGMQDIVRRARLRGIKVHAVTITPYYGYAGSVVYPDIVRRQVNEWIRTSRTFDSVFDFDAIVRDPDDPTRLRREFNPGDHIHLNPAGYAAVAASIPLSALDDKLK